MKELFGVEGRVILITGASRGIGFAMAEALGLFCLMMAFLILFAM